MSGGSWVAWAVAVVLLLGAVGSAGWPRVAVQPRLRRPVRAASPRDRPGGPAEAGVPLPDHLLGEVVAALIEAGSPPAEALRHVARALRAVDDPRAQVWLQASAALLHTSSAPAAGFADRAAEPARGRVRAARWRHGTPGSGQESLLDAVTGALLLAARSGLPPADVVRECALAERRSRAERSARRLARLPVLLVLPLGLCLLPASALLGVAPVVLGLLTQLRL